jgi:hypothetical protein
VTLLASLVEEIQQHVFDGDFATMIPRGSGLRAAIVRPWRKDASLVTLFVIG